MYKCGWNGCEKAYGTLNHLNAHVTMQSHGTKRTPEGTSSNFPLILLPRNGLFFFVLSCNPFPDELGRIVHDATIRATFYLPLARHRNHVAAIIVRVMTTPKCLKIVFMCYSALHSARIIVRTAVLFSQLCCPFRSSVVSSASPVAGRMHWRGELVRPVQTGDNLNLVSRRD